MGICARLSARRLQASSRREGALDNVAARESDKALDSDGVLAGEGESGNAGSRLRGDAEIQNCR